MRTVGCWLMVVGLMVLHGAASAEALRGLVVGISDGDTLKVLDERRVQHTIRLQGIDAPESKQAFGTRSKQSLAEMVHGKHVVVVHSNAEHRGRIIGVVTLNGYDVNLEQVRRGMAWHYKQYAKQQARGERRAYAEAEMEAKEAKRGLWIDEDPTAPWDFRAAKRQSTLF